VVVLSGLLFPLLLGRAAFTLLHVPAKFYHDPFAFAVGVGGCCVLRSALAVLLDVSFPGGVPKETHKHCFEVFASLPPDLFRVASQALRGDAVSRWWGARRMPSLRALGVLALGGCCAG
jgi:hypothetical protein